MRKKVIKPEKLFAILATLFIGISIFLVPINRAPDESNHARMSWQILYRQTEDSYSWMGELKDIGKVDKKQYKSMFTDKVDFSNETFDLNLSGKSVQHIPQLIGMKLGQLVYPSIGVMITLGRIMNAALFIVAMYFVIKKAKYGKNAIILISLLPIMIQQAGSLSYDVLNFIVVMGIFSFITNLNNRNILDWRNVVGIFLAIFGCYITKMNNYFLLCLFPLMLLKFPEKFKKINIFLDKVYQLFRKWAYLIVGIVIISILMLAMLYLKNKGGITNFIQVLINSTVDSNLNGQINGILSLGIFGYLGHFQIQMPLWLIFIDVVFLAILMLSEVDIKVPKMFGLVAGLIFPIQVLVIIGGMYFAWTPKVLGENSNISVGAQGRYFTPFLIFYAPFFQSMKDKVSVRLNKNFESRTLLGLITINFIVMIFLLLFYYWFPERQADWLIHLREMLA